MFFRSSTNFIALATPINISELSYASAVIANYKVQKLNAGLLMVNLILHLIYRIFIIGSYVPHLDYSTA